jgi:hypothetical protein
MLSIVFVIVVKITEHQYEDSEDEQLYLSYFTFVTLFVKYIIIFVLRVCR